MLDAARPSRPRLIVVVSRAGLLIGEALALKERDLDQSHREPRPHAHAVEMAREQRASAPSAAGVLDANARNPRPRLDIAHLVIQLATKMDTDNEAHRLEVLDAGGPTKNRRYDEGVHLAIVKPDSRAARCDGQAREQVLVLSVLRGRVQHEIHTSSPNVPRALARGARSSAHPERSCHANQDSRSGSWMPLRLAAREGSPVLARKNHRREGHTAWETGPRDRNAIDGCLDRWAMEDRARSQRLDYLYREYVRISELSNAHARSSFDDVRLLAAVGFLLAWPPISMHVLPEDAPSHAAPSQQTALLVGFVAITCVVNILAIRDLMKQSLVLFVVERARLIEVELRDALGPPDTAAFRIGDAWGIWGKQHYEPILLHFYGVFIALLVIFPNVVLALSHRPWTTAVHTPIVLALTALFVSATRRLPEGLAGGRLPGRDQSRACSPLPLERLAWSRPINRRRQGSRTAGWRARPHAHAARQQLRPQETPTRSRRLPA